MRDDSPIDDIDADFIRRMEEPVIHNESGQSNLRETTPRPGEILTSCGGELGNTEMPKSG